ncbi:DUF2895 family protein [Vibrio cholerae]|nr:DUF2895 family protein [Vibrio cholerae]
MNMGSRAAKIDEERLDTIAFQRKVIMGFFVVLVVLIIGLIIAFSVRRIWVSPDLSSGQMITVNSPYRAYPYTFTYRFISVLWNWSEDGAKEYPILIKSASESYAEEGMVNELRKELADLKSRGVLNGRTRQVKEIIPRDPSAMVKSLSSDKFVVFVDLEIVDKLNGSVVSVRRERFSYTVAVTGESPDVNQYGLKLVSYYRAPEKLHFN